MRAGLPGLVGDQGRQQGGMSGLRLLASEPAPHPRADAYDHVLAQAEAMRDHGLDLARVLGRGVDGDLARLAGNGQGRLGLQVEMLLPAGAEGPFDHVLGPLERGRGVSPRHPAGRADEVTAGDRVVDRQNGRQRFHLEPDRGPGRAQGRPALAGQHDDRLADMMALVRGQQLLVVEDRAEMVVARHVGRREHRRDPLDLRAAAATSIATIRPCAIGLPTNSTSSSLRNGGISSRYTAWPVTWALRRLVSDRRRRPAVTGRRDRRHAPTDRPRPCRSRYTAARSGRLVIELEQDVLGELQAERRASRGRRKSARPRPGRASRLAKGLLGERPAGQKRLGPRQSERRRADAAVRDRRRVDQIAPPLAIRMPARKVETSISFRLEILYSFTISSRAGQRDQDARDDLVGCEDRLLRPAVEVLDGHAPAAARRSINSSSASTISRKQSESATGEPWAMLPTSVATLRICGEPNRSVSAWISGRVPCANASSRAQVTLAPTERTSPSRVDPRQLADAREAQDDGGSSPCLFRCDAQLGGARGDDRAGCRARKATASSSRVGRKKIRRPGLDQDRRSGTAASSSDIDARRIETRQPPYSRSDRSTGRPRGSARSPCIGTGCRQGSAAASSPSTGVVLRRALSMR